MSPSLSIIIPAYNEAPRIGSSLEAIFAYLNEQAYESEVIVVDDGSKDDTISVVERCFGDYAGRASARVVPVRPNRGKGHAVRTGLLDARAPIALFSDADLSTPITETPKLVAPIRAGEYDVVFGSRALDRSLIGVHQPWQREQSGRIFNFVMRMMTGLPFWDTQCGFKAFRMDVCRPIVEGGLIDRFGFDVELLYVSYLAGLRLYERAVRWDDREGSKVSLLNGLHGFGELRELRSNVRRGRYAEAIRDARALSTNVRESAPMLTINCAPPESDASPELAGTAQRI